MPPIIYAVLFPSDEGERPLQSTSPAGQAKVFHCFSHVYLYKIYSVLVILPSLDCSQVETGLHSRAPSPYK
jgi:hypothetical protein